MTPVAAGQANTSVYNMVSASRFYAHDITIRANGSATFKETCNGCTGYSLVTVTFKTEDGQNVFSGTWQPFTPTSNAPGSPLVAGGTGVEKGIEQSAQAGGLKVAVSLTKATVSVGGEVDATVKLMAGNEALTGVRLVKGLTLSSDAAMVSQAPTASGSFNLAAGASRSFVFTVKGARAGEVTLRASAVGTARSGQVRGGGETQLKVLEAGIVVNTDLDANIDQRALDENPPVCSVNINAPTRKCSLRAAVELVNKLHGSQTITFDIPGGGVPKIEIDLGEPLPPVNASVTIDGGTQPGGWVELSGTGADGNGLELDGANSTLRGLVINGFAKGDGILVASGSGDVIAGDRIGSNPSGEMAVPNKIGVEVRAARTTIGGTAGTKPDTCAGDCDLLSGNTRSEVSFGTGGSGAITGDTIGPDLNGEKVLAWVTGSCCVHSGVVSIGTEFSPRGEDPGFVSVGGATSAPGVAPGNVIAGGTMGVLFAVRSGGVVAGNMIGLNRAGTRSLEGSLAPLLSAKPTAGFPDVSEGDPLPTQYSGVAASAGVVIGGHSSADANVISGFPIGVTTANALVEHDLIGTNAAGNAAIGNGEGVHRAHVVDSLVSGNLEDGIYDPSVVTGSRIGTNAAGTAAVPNGYYGIVGVNLGADELNGVIGGVHADGSESCSGPCNLISGNGRGAVAEVSTVQGNFIGTDLSGTKAIPNGSYWNTAAGRQRASELRYSETAVYAVARLGGPSHATNGKCDLACNVISGNDEGAITVIGGFLKGNLIGRSISDSPLPNNGVAITSIASGGIVGGDGDEGNVIADNSGGAIEGHDTAPKIAGNSITGNEDGIVYEAGAKAPAPLAAPTVSVKPGGQVTLSGHIHVFHSGSNFISRVDVYADTTCERGPQGMVPLGSVTAGLLSGDWMLTVPNLPPSLKYFTVTLTVDDSTSTFSSCGSASP